MANEKRPDEHHTGAGVTLIAECVATYLAMGNKYPSAQQQSIELAHQFFYDCAQLEHLPSSEEIDRIRQKIDCYLPWHEWLEQQSLRLTPKALKSIRSICYFACFPPLPAGPGINRFKYPPSVAEFPMQEILDQIVDDASGSTKLAINRTALKEDLQLCLVCFRIESQFDSKTRFGGRTEHLAKIKNRARQLRELLSLGVEAWNEMGIDWVLPEELGQPRWISIEDVRTSELQSLNSPEPDVHDFLNGPLLQTLTHLIEETDRLMSESEPGPLLRDRRAPMERFLGQNLPTIFEVHFGIKAGGGEGGPFSRFSQNVLKMMRESIAPGTVVSAMSDVRKKQFRRKNHKPKFRV